MQRVNSYNQAAVHPAASEVGCIFCQIHGSEPLHHPVVGPLHHVRRRDVALLQGEKGNVVTTGLLTVFNPKTKEVSKTLTDLKN